MDIQILIGLLISVLPILELRGGLPILVEYSIRNNVSIWPYFFLMLILNILMVFFIFIFLDFIHNIFMRNKWYNSKATRILKKTKINIDKVKNRMTKWGYIILILFVAVPLPGSGFWTGSLIAWALKLNRMKSIIAILIGIVISGFIILLLSLGFFTTIK